MNRPSLETVGKNQQRVHIQNGPIVTKLNRLSIPILVLPVKSDPFSDSKMFRRRGGRLCIFRLRMDFLSNGAPTLTTSISAGVAGEAIRIVDNEIVEVLKYATRWADICNMDRTQ